MPQNCQVLPPDVHGLGLAVLRNLPVELKGNPHFTIHLVARNVEFPSAHFKHVPLLAWLQTMPRSKLFVQFLHPLHHNRFEFGDSKYLLQAAQHLCDLWNAERLARKRFLRMFALP